MPSLRTSARPSTRSASCARTDSGLAAPCLARFPPFAVNCTDGGSAFRTAILRPVARHVVRAELRRPLRPAERSLGDDARFHARRTDGAAIHRVRPFGGSRAHQGAEPAGAYA